MAFHTMAILQAYQVDVLKEMDEGGGLTHEAVKDSAELPTWCCVQLRTLHAWLDAPWRVLWLLSTTYG